MKQNPSTSFSASLVRSTAWSVGMVMATIVVAATTGLCVFIYHQKIRDEEESLRNYANERAARESQQFALMEASHSAMHDTLDDVLRFANGAGNSEWAWQKQRRFDALFAQDANGIWRDRSDRLLDLSREPTLFVGFLHGKPVTLSDIQKQELMLLYEFIDVHSASYKNQFANLYITTPDNARITFWQNVAWSRDADQQIDVRSYLIREQEERSDEDSDPSNPNAKKTIWSKMRCDMPSKECMITAETKIYSNSRLIGVLSSDILLSDLTAHVLSDAPAHTACAVLDDDGVWIIPPPNVNSVDEYLHASGEIAGPHWQFVVHKSLSAIHAEMIPTLASVILGGIFVLIAQIWVLSLMLSQRIATPLQRLSHRAEQIALGKFDTPILVGRSDELGLLSMALNALMQAVSQRDARLSEQNLKLEAAVASRTRDLERRNREMQKVLDHIGAGLVIIDARGSMDAERSQQLLQWFGDAPIAASLVEYIRPHDGEFANWLDMGLAQLRQRIFAGESIDAAIQQLPQQIIGKGCMFTVVYHPIYRTGSDGKVLERILVSIDNTFDPNKVANNDSEQNDAVRIFENFSRDTREFAVFYGDMEQLFLQFAYVKSYKNVVAINDEDLRTMQELMMRMSMYGLDLLSRICHSVVNSAMQKREETGVLQILDGDRHWLLWSWRATSTRLQHLLGEDLHDALQELDAIHTPVVGILAKK